MQELSLNVLDIAQNSISADASLTEISLMKYPTKDSMIIQIKDNGKGMTKEQVEAVENPFFTTRTTRPVGLGVPLFKMSAEMTGGSFKIESEKQVGTTVTATYVLSHIDLMPVGDMTATILSLISLNPHLDFTYTYQVENHSFCLDTREIRQVLEGVGLETPEVQVWLKEYLQENTAEVDAAFSNQT